MNRKLSSASSFDHIKEDDQLIDADLPDDIKTALLETDVKAAIQHVKDGEYIYKYTRGILLKHTRPHQRLLIVNLDQARWRLQWESPNKNHGRSIIYFTNILKIVPGVCSDYFKHKDDEDKELGIEIISTNAKLRIRCTVLKSWKLWMRGLLYTHRKCLTREDENSKTSVCSAIRRLWRVGNPANETALHFQIILDLFHEFRLSADVRYAQQLFNKINVHGAPTLEYKAFEFILRRLVMNSTLMNEFQNVRDKLPEALTEAEFIGFLQDAQKHTQAEAEAEAHRAERMLHQYLRLPDHEMSDLAFCFIMTSEFNSICSRSLKSTVDLTQPLAHYWIATASNPCWLHDVSGVHPLEQLRSILGRGFRCLDFEVWNGPDDMAIIYFGPDPKQYLPFSLVCKVCREAAFMVSRAPLILSLTIQCDDLRCQRVAQDLNEMFGSMLVKCDDVQTGEFASELSEDNQTRIPIGLPPASMMNRVLVCVKWHQVDDLGGIKDAEETGIRRKEQALDARPMARKTSPQTCQERKMKSHLAENFAPPLLPSVREKQAKATHRFGHARSMIKYKRSSRNSLELEQFNQISCLLDVSSARPTFPETLIVRGISEQKMGLKVRHNPGDWVTHHQNHLTRTYPSNTRHLICSRFSPTVLWRVGCQMVGCTVQAGGIAALTTLGRFASNGFLGYVLKPYVLRSTSPFDPSNFKPSALPSYGESCWEVTIKVLSARQLPLIKTASDTVTDLVPFVVVSIQGVQRDCSMERTNAVVSSGLEPKWTHSPFVFDVLVPSLAMLIFEVRNSDVAQSRFLAGAAIPMTCVRQGIRWVPLMDIRGRPIPWCGLLVSVTIKPSRNQGMGIHLMSDHHVNHDAMMRRRSIAPLHQSRPVLRRSSMVSPLANMKSELRG